MITPTGQAVEPHKKKDIWHGGPWVLELDGEKANVQSACGTSMIYSQGRLSKLLKNGKVLLEVYHDTVSGKLEMITTKNRVVISQTLDGFEVENLSDEKFEIHCDLTEKGKLFNFSCNNMHCSSTSGISFNKFHTL